MKQRSRLGDTASASLQARRTGRDGARLGGVFSVMCHDQDGNLRWQDEAHNIVTNAGLNHVLDATLSAGTQITTWYVGLTDGTPTVAAGDTMSSHAGWAEVTNYDEAARQTWTDGGVASQSVDNSASPAVFTCSTNGTTVGGSFLTSSSTKGGTTGTLYSVAAYSGGDKSVDDGDTLTITYTFTAADDGV